jgi:hypothetical protein
LPVLVAEALFDSQALALPALGFLPLPPLLCYHPQLEESNSVVAVVASVLIVIFELVENRILRIKVTAIVGHLLTLSYQRSPGLFSVCQ